MNLFNLPPTSPTGREDMHIVFCPKCGWRDREREGATPSAQATIHNRCLNRDLAYVSFEAATERAAADEYISRVCGGAVQ